MIIKADQKAGWQKIGSVISEYTNKGFVIDVSGTWCFNTNERDGRTCEADGRSGAGNYWPMKVPGETSYILHDQDAVLGELVGRIGNNGTPFRIGKHLSGVFDASDVGKDIFVSMNHGWYTVNSDGTIEVGIRIKPDPLPDPVQEGEKRKEEYWSGHLHEKDWNH
ncbi:hypothetical protein [Pseudomonas brassicacearum]|uniref:Uncharacterized protein n=1 Tax=Pseudomonas brassicacearum TaxID=930166 RepID=A0A423H1Z6_9PSED|nr:hypothetical protein [Pseudomonas brassicacearum]RON06248.1 hypothetical protein BK658_00220 [Pseudomonas brassicacearum]